MLESTSFLSVKRDINQQFNYINIQMTHLMLKLFLALIRHIYDDAYSLR